MKNVKKLFAGVLMAAVLGSLAGCIIAEGPYPGHARYRYRDPAYRHPDPHWRYGRYERYRDHRRDDYRYRDWHSD